MRMPCCSLPSSLGLLSALPLNTWQPSRIPYLSDYQVGHEGSHQKCPQGKSFKIAKWAHPPFYSGAWIAGAFGLRGKGLTAIRVSSLLNRNVTYTAATSISQNPATPTSICANMD